MAERVVIEAAAPPWAHALAVALNKIIAGQAQRIRELEERIKTLEAL